MARESCHLDRVHAAHLLGVAPITIKKWETGEKTPNLQGMWACSEVYDVEIEWFLMPEDLWKKRQRGELGPKTM
jgi:DNA-binding XRE family transcriptional regulator